jgi:hypothetical protein
MPVAELFRLLSHLFRPTALLIWHWHLQISPLTGLFSCSGARRAWASLEDVIISGPSNGYSPKKSRDGSGTLSLKLTATTRGSIVLYENAVKRLSEVISKGSDLFLRSGDLLFQRGNTIEYVGVAAVYEGPEATYVYPDLMIRVRTGDKALTQWIWRVANSPVGRKYMRENATGTAGTMPQDPTDEPASALLARLREGNDSGNASRSRRERKRTRLETSELPLFTGHAAGSGSTVGPD